MHFSFTSTVFPQKVHTVESCLLLPEGAGWLSSPGPPTPGSCLSAPCPPRGAFSSALGGPCSFRRWLCHRAPGLWRLQTAGAMPFGGAHRHWRKALLPRLPAFPGSQPRSSDALWASSLALVHPHLLTFRAAGRPCPWFCCGRHCGLGGPQLPSCKMA